MGKVHLRLVTDLYYDGVPDEHREACVSKLIELAEATVHRADDDGMFTSDTIMELQKYDVDAREALIPDETVLPQDLVIHMDFDLHCRGNPGQDLYRTSMIVRDRLVKLLNMNMLDCTPISDQPVGLLNYKVAATDVVSGLKSETAGTTRRQDG